MALNFMPFRNMTLDITGNSTLLASERGTLCLNK
jgi:hypothetical protein